MKKNIIIFLSILFLGGFSACVKEKFAAPPVTNTDPDITPNITIAALSALYTGTPYQITQNLILEAVVVGDDKSGNLYKELVIEDSTAGIVLMINGSDLYTTYPVGRRLFINLKGLYVVSYSGSFEIAGSVSGTTYTGIPTTNLSQYITPGKWGISVVAKALTVSQLLSNINAYQSELIELSNVEFVSGSRGVPYANAKYELSSTLNIKDCNFNQVAVYTSGYADFASAVTPSGNGTMVCISGVFTSSSGTAAQLTIRDTTDLNMTATPCP